MKKTTIALCLFFAYTASPALAQTDESELPATLKCYRWSYNDRSGARSRSNLSAHPIMKIEAANFKSPAPSHQKVLVKALDEEGNVTATDQALVSMIITPAGYGHGGNERTLSIRVVEVTGNVIWKSLTLWQDTAMDSKHRFYNYWTSEGYQDNISCFTPDHLPK